MKIFLIRALLFSFVLCLINFIKEYISQRDLLIIYQSVVAGFGLSYAFTVLDVK